MMRTCDISFPTFTARWKKISPQRMLVIKVGDTAAMTHSLGLTLYNLGARTLGEAQPATPPPVRPKGVVIWLHAPSRDSLASMGLLARILYDEDGVSTVLTGPDWDGPDHPGLSVQAPPAETVAAARAFLDHWHPAAVIMAEGELRPATLHEAQERGLPTALLDARDPHLMRDRDGWWPGLVRSTLAGFGAVLAIDEPAARALRKAGARAGAVQVTGRLEHPSMALPHAEAERMALAQLLAVRPVWFVPALPQAEEAMVISAHRAALRHAHRLLLIAAPQDPSRAGPLAERMEKIEGWTVASRLAEEEPDDETQVFLVDATELGLWYRLAPVTYLGGSLTPDGCIRDPFEAAALGSAIIHGPRAGPHGAAIGRLAAAQATALVSSSSELGEALAELLSPDRSARLSHAAWGVASDGAAATEAALTLIRGFLEKAA
jgi:3-deoxy-D-manno-octulosonic-acid transferase